MRNAVALSAVLVALSWPVAMAQQAPASSYDSLQKCRDEPDPEKRLQCYDDASGRLNRDVESGNAVIIDKQKAQETERQNYGLPPAAQPSPLPSMAEEKDIESLTDTVKVAKRLPTGRWKLTLASGAVWRQTDGRLSVDPKVGSVVELTGGLLGGYFMKVDGQVAVKAHRVK